MAADPGLQPGGEMCEMGWFCAAHPNYLSLAGKLCNYLRSRSVHVSACAGGKKDMKHVLSECGQFSQ